MKAGSNDGQSLTTHLPQFLLSHRLSPHATTGVTPSALFLQRKIHTRLDLLKPDIKSFVSLKQSQQKLHHDITQSIDSFQLAKL